jgi:hypothetical protein
VADLASKMIEVMQSASEVEIEARSSFAGTKCNSTSATAKAERLAG